MFSAKNYNDTIRLECKGGHGFFSNCSFVLTSILDFVKQANKLPLHLDSSALFPLYKKNPTDVNEDIMKKCFEQKRISNIQIDSVSEGDCCFCYCKAPESPFKQLNLSKLSLYIDAYFTPSATIKEIINTIEKTYLINYETTCTVYYRGTDKITETVLASYKEFFDKADEILLKNPNIRFFIQTDELEFATAFKQKFNNSFSIKELAMASCESKKGVHFSIKQSERTLHASWFLAAVIIMSKTKHIITASANGALWVVLYRGNFKNVHQYLHQIDYFTKKPKKNFGWI